MFTAYEELVKVVKPEEITKITLGEIELAKETTLELMKETTIVDIFEKLIFWTEDSRIEKVKDYNFDGDFCPYYKKTKIKPRTKVTPESLTELWKDPETGMDLPLKTQAYLEEEFEPLILIDTDTRLVIDL